MMFRFLHTHEPELARQQGFPLDTVAVLQPEIFWTKAGGDSGA
jgi:hypothetical protein